MYGPVQYGYSFLVQQLEITRSLSRVENLFYSRKEEHWLTEKVFSDPKWVKSGLNFLMGNPWSPIVLLSRKKGGDPAWAEPSTAPRTCRPRVISTISMLDYEYYYHSNTSVSKICKKVKHTIMSSFISFKLFRIFQADNRGK
jgi:hypothetical protein